jgi:hypothetical protein
MVEGRASGRAAEGDSAPTDLTGPLMVSDRRFRSEHREKPLLVAVC